MPSGGQNKIDRGRLIRDIRGLARMLGETPSQTQYKEYGIHSRKPVMNEFGNWNNALDEIGLEVNQRRNPVTIECAYCGAEDQKRPSRVESAKYNYCSPECVSEHKKERYSGDGNPRSTLVEVECESCGDTIPRPKWRRDKSDMFFCDFACWGDWISDNRTGEDNPRWSELPTETYYGYHWPEQRRKAIIRDQARCQYPGCGITEKEHRQRHDRGLEVHHITPLAEFRDGDTVDYESANSLSNLITVCRACHRKAESNSSRL